MRLKHEVDPLGDKKIHEVSPDLTRFGRYAQTIFMHPNDHPAESSDAGVINRIGHPVVSR
jgi:hypothetical protein